MKKYFFITGMSRSGTTLLDKILCNHPQLSVLSQPFPFLFIEAKKKFLDSINYGETPFPLSNYFQEVYRPKDFSEFLETVYFDADELGRIFNDMKEFSGQYTKRRDINRIISDYKRDKFIEIFKKLLIDMAYNQDRLYFGSKECICEEFVGFLSRNDFKNILLIRDPRDIIVSSYYGRASEYIGKYRPLLFHLRNWRKSIAFLIHHKHNPNLAWLKFEDMVQSPQQSLEKVTKFLNIDPFSAEFFSRSILDQKGNVWLSNSSFKGEKTISNASVGRYKNKISRNMLNYIEYICYPEMRYLGYKLQNAKILKKYIYEFKEPFRIKRKEHKADFSTLEENLSQEKKRLKFLKEGNLSKEKIEKYFIFQDVFLNLQEAISN
ncbi:hypothetical protein GF362_03410 [Candidatus Dojkabacteria bacterium]|nr:hypothetical protein [Candidatus Dojkabacteria bacterium]